MKKCINKLNLRSKKNIRFRINDSITDNPYEVGNSFNEHVSSVGQGDIANGFEHPLKGRSVLTLAINSMYLFSVDTKEVHHIIEI